jgi:hypothetical protein
MAGTVTHPAMPRLVETFADLAAWFARKGVTVTVTDTVPQPNFGMSIMPSRAGDLVWSPVGALTLSDFSVTVEVYRAGTNAMTSMLWLARRALDGTGFTPVTFAEHLNEDGSVTRVYANCISLLEAQTTVDRWLLVDHAENPGVCRVCEGHVDVYRPLVDGWVCVDCERAPLDWREATFRRVAWYRWSVLQGDLEPGLSAVAVSTLLELAGADMDAAGCDVA